MTRLPDAKEAMKPAAEWLDRHARPKDDGLRDLISLCAQAAGADAAGIWVSNPPPGMLTSTGVSASEADVVANGCARLLEDSGEGGEQEVAADPRFSDTSAAAGLARIHCLAGAGFEAAPGAPRSGFLWVAYREARRSTERERPALLGFARQAAKLLELRRVVGTLAEIQERYFLLFEKNPLPMWIFDLKTYAFLVVSDAALAQYGYTREELSGLTVKDIRPEEDLPAFLDASDRVLGAYRPAGRWRHQRKDGTRFPVEIFSHDMVYEGRDARLVLAVDVSEHDRSARALRASESRFRALSEAAPIGIVEIDAAGRLTYCNAALARIMGREAASILAEGWDACIHPTDASAIREAASQALQRAESLNHEYRIIRPDQSVRWVRFLASPQKDAQGRFSGMIGTVEDITDRLQAEERFQLLANATSDVLWDWDLPTNRLWWSEGLQTLFGFSATELDSTIESWTSRIHADDRERTVAGLHAAIGQGETLWAEEYRFLCEDGHYAVIRSRAQIVRDHAGTAIRVVAGMTDITEQKKLEGQYLRAQRMESIGTLAGGIAHDLNNVLAPILMAIELLKQQSGGPAQMKLLDTIETSTRRGASLVRQVLTFARGVEGQRIALQPLLLLKEVAKIAAETFPRLIRIETAFPGELWPVLADPTQLHQVLLNLGVNARDAMPQGGVLTLAARNVIIDEQYAHTSKLGRAGQHVVISVADTGAGIPREAMPHIFEPFFTTKKAGEGTGLGLATVHAIIKSHEGFVTVTSEPGKGSTFCVHLPADTSLQSASEHPFVLNTPRGMNELVLVVDDEPAIRAVTQQTLEAFGYRVLTAADGAEAVALYVRNKDEIALVLTDMVMPVMDGPTTIAALLRINPHLPVIAASGYNATPKGAQTPSSAIRHFLPKPYNAETLLRLVRAALDDTSS